MATVIKLQGRDFTGVGRAITQLLEDKKDKRLDGLQSELLREIADAPDEATAAALLGDVTYTDVIGDPIRFSQLVQAIGTMQPGFDVLPAYNEAGERIPLSVRKGTRITEETFSSQGLHSQPRVTFYSDDLGNDEDIPRLLGSFRSRGEAEQAQRDSGIDGDFAILGQQETNIATQAASIRGGQRRANISTYLDQQRFRIDQAKGYTPFSHLIYDHDSGLIDDKFFQEAWKALTFRSGLTPEDLKAAYSEDASENWAAVENMSVLFSKMVEKVVANPLILTNIGAIPKIGAKIGAELEAIAALTGMSHKSIDEYNWGSLASESNVLKGMFLDAAIVSARADGQTGKQLSDRDLQLFLDRVGRDISDVPSFVKNLDNLAKRHQREFFVDYRAFTRQEWTGADFTQIQYTQKSIDEKFRERAAEEYGVTIGGGDLGLGDLQENIGGNR